MSGDTFLLLARLGFSLALVFGLMWVAGRVMKGRSPIAVRRGNDHLEVLERKALSRTSSIAVVRVGEQVFALGVSDQQVTVLSALDADTALGEQPVHASQIDAPPVSTPASAPVTTPTALDRIPEPHTQPTSRQGWLDSLRDKTVRHIPS